jgi:hypothetical protein
LRVTAPAFVSVSRISSCFWNEFQHLDAATGST